MPRAREALTGHIWLASLSTDEEDGTAIVYNTFDVSTNMDWLISKHLLVLCRKCKGEFTVHCYPRRDRPPAPGANHASSYKSDCLAAALQAAVNDYSHTLGMTAKAQYRTHEVVRAVIEGNPF